MLPSATGPMQMQALPSPFHWTCLAPSPKHRSCVAHFFLLFACTTFVTFKVYCGNVFYAVKSPFKWAS